MRDPFLVLCEVPFEPRLRALVAGAHPLATVEFRPPAPGRDHDEPDARTRPGFEPATALISHWPPRDWSRAGQLEWIQVDSAGVDYLADHEVWTRPVTLTNAAGAYATQIAQYVMAGLLAVFDRHALRREAQLARQWPDWGVPEREAMIGRPLRGATMVVVGYGGVGREVGRLAKAFGMQLIAIKARPAVRIDRSFVLPGTGDPDGVLPDQILGVGDLASAAAEADALVITLPLTAETRGVVDRDVLHALPSTAWVVNVARGAVLDNEELIRLLRAGRIGGALLDVFDPEPLPSSSPLWRLRNVIATPHVAGGGPASRELFVHLAVENLRRFAEGRPLLNVVDPSTRY